MAELKLERIVSQKAPLLEPFTVTFRAGEVWGILGENGAGKSDLLHLLAALPCGYQGRILLNGVDVRKLPRKVLAQRLGIQLQHLEVALPFSVYDWVLAGRYPHIRVWGQESAEDEDRVLQALQKTGLLAQKSVLVSKLTDQQRCSLELATLLAQAPEVLLLDEPGALLPLNPRLALLDHFRLLAHEHQHIVVMGMRDPNLAARLCDHLLLLYPDGHLEAGPTGTMLTPEKLTAVYNHPLIQAEQAWLPV